MIAIALLVVVLAAAIVLSFLASAPQELWYPVAGHLPSTSFRQEPSPRVQHVPEHAKNARQGIRRAGLARTRSSCMSTSPMPALGSVRSSQLRRSLEDFRERLSAASGSRIQASTQSARGEERVEIPNPAHRNRKDTQHPPRHGRTTEARRKRDGDAWPPSNVSRSTISSRSSPRPRMAGGSRSSPTRSAQHTTRVGFPLLQRLGCRLVQRNDDVEDAVCSALVALAVMRRSRTGRYVFAAARRARAAARRGDCPYCREHE